MRSTRCSIVLYYDSRQEVAKGVWENKLTPKTIKAQQEQIYQRRQDAAMLEGLVITARFKVRTENIEGDLKYVIWQGNKYKVNQVTENITNHFSTIEIGEMI